MLPKDSEENLLTCLVDLFMQIQTSKKKTGVIPPKKFVQRLKRDNELFRSYMHQDAHEFLNYLLNQMCETITRREEVFMDLSLEIDHNTSITSCLKQYSKTEMLAETEKFECECCGSHQEAQKRIKICSLPSCLILHLKRFKYIEQLHRSAGNSFEDLTAAQG
eukprot:gene6121-6360_t